MLGESTRSRAPNLIVGQIIYFNVIIATIKSFEFQKLLF